MSQSIWPNRRLRTQCTSALTRLVTCLLVGITSHDVMAQNLPAVSEATPAPEVTDAELAKRHEEFSKLLTGRTMHGFFSVDGKEKELKEDRYDIESVTKVPNGELWLFKVRIRYGDHDVTVPLPLTVSWAGKTPVIVVDKLTIPGMGTFDARVVIADQRYAGTWQHGRVGGHLYGNIVATEEAPPAAEEKSEPTDDGDQPAESDGTSET